MNCDSVLVKLILGLYWMLIVSGIEQDTQWTEQWTLVQTVELLYISTDFTSVVFLLGRLAIEQDTGYRLVLNILI